MITDTTKRKRREHFSVKRKIRKLNQDNNRLVWVRETLGLTMAAVSRGAKIPLPTYSDRESGRRTVFYEYFLTLSVYFNGLWQKEFPHNVFPRYKDEPVERISVEFLMFGKDLSQKYVKDTLYGMEQVFKIKELELVSRCSDLEAALTVANRKLKQYREKFEQVHKIH